MASRVKIHLQFKLERERGINFYPIIFSYKGWSLTKLHGFIMNFLSFSFLFKSWHSGGPHHKLTGETRSTLIQRRFNELGNDTSPRTYYRSPKTRVKLYRHHSGSNGWLLTELSFFSCSRLNCFSSSTVVSFLREKKNSD